MLGICPWVVLPFVLLPGLVEYQSQTKHGFFVCRQGQLHHAEVRKQSIFEAPVAKMKQLAIELSLQGLSTAIAAF